MTGGVSQAPPDKLFGAVGESIEYTQDLWPWVLLLVACMLVADIYLRRVRLFGYRTIRM